jgi:hypothetical protein
VSIILILVISDDVDTESIVESICRDEDIVTKDNILILNQLQFVNSSKADFQDVKYVLLDADYPVEQRNGLEEIIRKSLPLKVELYKANQMVLKDKIATLKRKEGTRPPKESEPEELNMRALDKILQKEINYDLGKLDLEAELDRLDAILKSNKFQVKRIVLSQKVLRLINDHFELKNKMPARKNSKRASG